MKILFGNYGRLFQYLATLSGSFSVISSGINLGWTSPYLPKLLDSSSDIPTTPEEGSWCAVMPLVGAPPGAFLAAFLVDRIGRKNTTLFMAPIMMAAFLAMGFFKNIIAISAARFLAGSVEGALYTALPMYIGEISDPKVRGKLSSSCSIAAIIGTLFINCIGPWTDILTSSLICATVPFIHFITFIFMPESPYYYIKKHRYEDAERSLKILRGSDDVADEIVALKMAVKRQEANPAKFTDLVTVPSNRRATLIYIIIIMTNKFSGKNPFLFYTTMIFEEANTKISPSIAVIMYCSVEIFSTLMALNIVDRYGRRPLLIFSATGCAISLAFEGTYFYLKQHHGSVVEHMGWWAIAALICYNIIFSVGLACGPVLLLSELFPTNIKGIALSTADSYAVVMGTIASKFFQFTKDTFGIFVPFWCFSIFCFIGLPFIIKIVPETKGKSLEGIQQELMGIKKLRNEEKT